ncbi:MAG TPA: hypothetical protein VGH74_10570 [Planctomycetaceae bacterium]|jgi:hypothetical protein
MLSVKARWKSGQIILDQPVDWPDGCELLVELVALPSEKIGIDEADWTDGGDSLADWDAWIATVEPLEYTADEDAAFARFKEEMRRFNIEAVRRQMEAMPE